MESELWNNNNRGNIYKYMIFGEKRSNMVKPMCFKSHQLYEKHYKKRSV